jgi:thioredoxin reductase (NADPH)
MVDSGSAKEREFELVIVGAGPAGLTAGLYAKRSELDAVVLERGLPGGQLLNTDLIDDYPGLPEVEGRELAERMTNHAKKFGLQIDTVTVKGIKKLEDGDFRITSEEGPAYRAPTVILTAGGTPNKLGVPGEEEYAGRGVSYCAICDGAFFKGEKIAVVGGGDAAAEEADFLTRYVDELYLIHRRDELRAQKILQKRIFENPKIEIVWNTVIEEVVGDEKGMTDLRLRNVESGEESMLNVTGLFVFIGFRPNTGLLEDHAEHDAGGYLISDRDMRASIPGLFVAGDVRAQLTRQITTAVGDATTAVIAAEKYLTELKQSRGTAGVSALPRGVR